ncbi:MAG: phosphoribosylanthranilate isomerase [Candidatus Hydrothermarchaeaceae archaeon]
MVMVKICGNTSVKDALKCAELGADFIGTVVEVPVQTPRKVTADEAAEIVSAIQPPTGRIIVVILRDVEEAVMLYRKIQPDFIQLQGSESIKFVKELRSLIPCNIIKTIHVGGEASIKEARKFSRCCDALLLDTPSVQMGGSGVRHDWGISRRIAEKVRIPVILAGGLNPENVVDAIKEVHPYAVDVASGVESRGKKDYKKVKKFIRNAKGAA